MLDIRKELAESILHRDEILNYRKWLAQEAGELALKFAGFDEFSSQANLTLAMMAEYGESDASSLALKTGIEGTQLQDHLQALCEFKFAEETPNGFKLTRFGEEAFSALGQNMLTRERFELMRRLAQLDELVRKMMKPAAR